jgi:hypothetical protein
MYLADMFHPGYDLDRTTIETHHQTACEYAHGAGEMVLMLKSKAHMDLSEQRPENESGVYCLEIDLMERV